MNLHRSIDENLKSVKSPVSIIRQITEAACKIPGKESISLGLGQLGEGFNVSKEIIKVLQQTVNELERGNNFSVMYSPNAGLPTLREAISERQKAKDGKNYTVDNVAITIGVQNALQATIGVLKQSGAKRVLIPEIYFGIYKSIPKNYGMEIVTYKLNSDYTIDLDDLRKKLKRDDLLIINSPANPTGKVFREKDLKELATILEERLTEGYVISDEIYDELVYEADLDIAPSISKYFDRVIILNGVSKSGAIAGIRVGRVISTNTDFIRSFVSFNRLQISCPPTLNQLMALPVVRGETRKIIKEYNRVISNNRDYVIKTFKKFNIPFVKPEGSFYIFPRIVEFIKGESDRKVYNFCYNLAKKENGVVVIPGEAFGQTEKATGNVRISMAVQQDKFKEGIKRLLEGLDL